MSYRSYAGASTSTGYTNETWGYAQSLMMYDIAAIQHIYGANYQHQQRQHDLFMEPDDRRDVRQRRGPGAPGGNQISSHRLGRRRNGHVQLRQLHDALTIDLQPGAWSITSQEQRAKLHWDGSKLAAGNIANALLLSGRHARPYRECLWRLSQRHHQGQCRKANTASRQWRQRQALRLDGNDV